MRHLERAVDTGFLGTNRWVERWRLLEPLEGDPRYEALQARTRERLDEERLALGLKSIGS